MSESVKKGFTRIIPSRNLRCSIVVAKVPRKNVTCDKIALYTDRRGIGFCKMHYDECAP